MRILRVINAVKYPYLADFGPFRKSNGKPRVGTHQRMAERIWPVVDAFRRFVVLMS